MSVELTDEQLELKKLAIQWYRNFPNGSPYFYYSGAAGTGKTTVMKSIIEDLGLKRNEYIACAYVGKAVLVLARNGLPASTIHSLIYNPSTETSWEIEYDEFGMPYKVKRKRSKFILKKQLPSSLKLIFIDECAMVNDKMREEIQSFGIPIIMAGDQNQLPPVFGKSTIQDNPDYVLHQIMRQKEGDPIIHLSQMILNGKQPELGSYGKSLVVDHYPFDKTLLTDFDAILCPNNNTREGINDSIRYDLLRYKDRIPHIGDKMICRRNSWNVTVNQIALTNGLVGYVDNINLSSIHRDVLYLDFKPDFMNNAFKKLTVDYNFLKSDWKTRKEYGWKADGMELFEYAYAITVHLSQGSEYNRVLFFDSNFRNPDKDMKMKYTAITRAKDRVIWVLDPDNFKRNNFYYNGIEYTL